MAEKGQNIFKEDFNKNQIYGFVVGNEGQGVCDELKGLASKTVAIPMNETIPDWLFPYIDYNTMVNNIMSSFKSVMELLKMPYVSEGKTKNGISRKTNKLSNIIIF